MPKIINFGEFLKTWSLRSNSITRQVSFNRTKIGGKCQNSNATFWVIFKQCDAALYVYEFKISKSRECQTILLCIKSCILHISSNGPIKYYERENKHQPGAAAGPNHFFHEDKESHFSLYGQGKNFQFLSLLPQQLLSSVYCWEKCKNPLRKNAIFELVF